MYILTGRCTPQSSLQGLMLATVNFHQMLKNDGKAYLAIGADSNSCLSRKVFNQHMYF